MFVKVAFAIAVKAVLPEPAAEKVVFTPFEIENPKWSLSNAPGPSGHFNDNRNESVLLPLSRAETFKPLNVMLVAVTTPFANQVVPSKSAMVFIASVQIDTEFEACAIVKAFRMVGKLSASFIVAPPSRIVNCHTCIPVVEVKFGAVFMVLEILVGDEPATATKSEF